MITEISPKLATLLQENEDLRDLLKFLIKEANFVGQTGKSVSNVILSVKKKNILLLRFFATYTLEWDEG